jgi:beta-phosphoglucomutase-like phosphatase (HAD superfamily)
MLIGPVDAIIFDVDGTLAETEEAHRVSFNEAFAEAGLPWRWTQDDYRDLLKVTGGKERIAHFMAITGSPLSGDLIPALHARKTEIYTGRVVGGAVGFRPGIEALIAEARRRGVALAIATTTSRPVFPSGSGGFWRAKINKINPRRPGNATHGSPERRWRGKHEARPTHTDG